jgi:hypothetical protein
MSELIDTFWPAIAWFTALFLIWAFLAGSKRRTNRRLRCIKRVPDRRTVNYDYQSVKDWL